MRNFTFRQLAVSGLVCLSLYSLQPAVQAGFSPEGSALQLVLKTIETSQHEIRLMGYSFTSPEVVSGLVRAKRRGVDVRVVLDWKANTGKNNNASKAAMNLLVGAGISAKRSLFDP